jgi:hypothetical protein
MLHRELWLSVANSGPGTVNMHAGSLAALVIAGT